MVLWLKFGLVEGIGIIDLFNSQIKFLFTENASELAKYYPNFYWLVIGFRYAVPTFIVFLFLFLIYKFKNSLVAPIKFAYKLKPDVPFLMINELIIFFCSLTLAILSYFLLQILPFNNFENRLFIAQSFLGFQLINLSLFIYFNKNKLLTSLRKFVTEAQLPYSLSITRILFFTYLGFMYLFIFKVVYAEVTQLPKVGLPFINWLVQITPVSPQLYQFSCWLGAFCALMIVIGYRTRFFLVLNSFVVFYVVATPNFFGKLWHMHIIIWIAWIMASSDCFDVFSLDAKRKEVKIVKSTRYGFPVSIFFMLFGIMYLFPGIHKLWISGFDWALSDAMINQVHLEWFENYNKVPKLRLDKIPWLLKIGGLTAIVFEIMWFFTIFYKPTKWIGPAGGIIMHNTIGYLMYISFFVMLQVFYIVFIPWNKLLCKFRLIQDNFVTEHSGFNLFRLKYLVPFLILSFNFIFGIGRIYSYPFSVYPVYSDLATSHFEYIEFKILDKMGRKIDLWEEAKSKNFRWESYSRFEPEIIQSFTDSNYIDTSRIQIQWQRWQNGIPELEDFDSIAVYASSIHLAPELQSDTIFKEYLFTIYK